MEYRVRRLDENGDIVTSGVIFAEKAEAIAQTISTRLKLFTGEYFRDITEGVPWFEKTDGSEGILSKGYSLSEIESLLRNTIANTDGVLTILTFSTDFDNDKRQFVVQATAATEYGTVEVSSGYD